MVHWDFRVKCSPSLTLHELAECIDHSFKSIFHCALKCMYFEQYTNGHQIWNFQSILLKILSLCICSVLYRHLEWAELKTLPGWLCWLDSMCIIQPSLSSNFAWACLSCLGKTRISDYEAEVCSRSIRSGIEPLCSLNYAMVFHESSLVCDSWSCQFPAHNFVDLIMQTWIAIKIPRKRFSWLYALCSIFLLPINAESCLFSLQPYAFHYSYWELLLGRYTAGLLWFCVYVPLYPCLRWWFSFMFDYIAAPISLRVLCGLHTTLHGISNFAKKCAWQIASVCVWVSVKNVSVLFFCTRK